MSRNPEYKFVSTDGNALVEKLIRRYTDETGRTLNPSDPDRLFLCWMADIIVRERVNQNYIGNQNIPSRADGENLDALGEYIYFQKRIGAQPSMCTVRFTLSVPAPEPVVIPKGTRVTDRDKSFVWSTVAENVINTGEQNGDIDAVCDTDGVLSNGLIPGQIDKLIDVDNVLYNTSVVNITTTYGGADVETDDEYYIRMRDSLEALSVAGPVGAYEYHARNVSSDIADVKAVMPRRKRVFECDIYKNTAGEEAAFLGSDGIVLASVLINGEKAGESFTLNYSEGLVKAIISPNGPLSGLSAVNVSLQEDMASRVYVYALKNDGNAADEDLKKQILTALSDEEVRPLADLVTVQDAEPVEYTIDFDYYIAENTEKSFAEIKAAVDAVVDQYILWQRSKFGRDINPSYLHDLLMHTGIKRAHIRAPIFKSINSGKDGEVPQFAKFTGDIGIAAKFGGYEDE